MAMTDEVKKAIAGYYREQRRLMNERDASIASLEKLQSELPPRLLLYLRDQTHLYFSPQISMLQAQIDTLQALQEPEAENTTNLT